MSQREGNQQEQVLSEEYSLGNRSFATFLHINS
jgi:hypothetical protein